MPVKKQGHYFSNAVLLLGRAILDMDNMDNSQIAYHNALHERIKKT